MREPSPTFLRMIKKVAGMAKSPLDFGTGDPLYFSESQIIYVVGNNPEINITELSNILGITKGTASPVANILAGRGCLNKLHASDDSKVVRLQLTERERVYGSGLQSRRRNMHPSILRSLYLHNGPPSILSSLNWRLLLITS